MSLSRKLLPLSASEVASTLAPALALLLQAHEIASRLKRASWECAVDLACLRFAGLRDSELSWLADQGYVEHVNGAKRPRRKARPSPSPCNGASRRAPRVVLTREGVRLARLARSAPDAASVLSPIEIPAGLSSNGATPRPSWDLLERTLRVGPRVVKRFRQPAANQELILSVLEEDGWPPHIDDPLPPCREMNSKVRLHQTINNLNRAQHPHLIHFIGDGKGLGVCWQLLADKNATPERNHHKH